MTDELYNKTMLGELTLGEVCRLVEQDTWAIEIGGCTTTYFSFPSLTEDGELCIYEDERDPDPWIFHEDDKVKPTGKGIELEGPDGKTVELYFIRAEHINVMEMIKCPNSQSSDTTRTTTSRGLPTPREKPGRMQ